MKWPASLLAVVIAFAASALALAGDNQAARSNILIITVDDLNWNSVGASGAPIKDITPDIDALASSSRRYEPAYVVASNCSPSHVALQTGLTPQQSGATGFFCTPTIATALRRAGYVTGVSGEQAHCNRAPSGQKCWDVQENFGTAQKYSASAISQVAARFFG